MKEGDKKYKEKVDGLELSIIKSIVLDELICRGWSNLWKLKMVTLHFGKNWRVEEERFLQIRHK